MTNDMGTQAKILVAYASKMGGTAGIAEAIGQSLRRRGNTVDVTQASAVGNLKEYGTVVVGSAIYFGRWRPEAVTVLRRLAAEPGRPQVWLFQSGPVSPDKVDPQPSPKVVSRLVRRLGAEPAKTFGGRLERQSARGLLARWMARGKLSGDLRDWSAIKDWAVSIHESLPSAGQPQSRRTSWPRL